MRLRSEVMRMCKSAVSVQAMSQAMLHPSQELRDLALTELREFRVEGDELSAITSAVAEQVQRAPGAGIALFERIAGGRSLGVLAQRLPRVEVAFDPLLQLWRSDPHDAIRMEAGKSIGALLGACGESTEDGSSASAVWGSVRVALRQDVAGGDGRHQDRGTAGRAGVSLCRGGRVAARRCCQLVVAGAEQPPRPRAAVCRAV